MIKKTKFKASQEFIHYTANKGTNTPCGLNKDSVEFGSGNVNHVTCEICIAARMGWRLCTRSHHPHVWNKFSNVVSVGYLPEPSHSHMAREVCLWHLNHAERKRVRR